MNAAVGKHLLSISRLAKLNAVGRSADRLLWTPTLLWYEKTNHKTYHRCFCSPQLYMSLMRSSRVLAVWVVVLLSLAVMPLSTTVPVPSDAQQDTTGTIKHAVNGDLSYLAINDSIQRNDTVTVSQDVGIAVSLDTTRFKTEYGLERIKIAHENASDEQAFATDKLDTIETRRDKLRAQQNKTIRQYNNGEITSEMFLRDLALISTEAQRIQVLANYLTDVGNESLTRRANDVNQELNMFQGPVRNRIRSALNGDPTAPNRFFVRTTTDGIVLATINDKGDEETYIREAYLDSARSQAAQPKSLGAEYMRKKVNELYEIRENYMKEELGVTSFYRYNLFPPEYASADDGKIKHYVDRGSGNIVFEQQRITTDAERTIEHESVQNEQLALTRWTTFSGGYMYVRLTNPEGGKPLNGTISVNGESVGTTDGETLLLLQPPNGSTITGTVGDDNVSITTGNNSRQPPGLVGG